jgi:hypothetical protein
MCVASLPALRSFIAEDSLIVRSTSGADSLYGDLPGRSICGISSSRGSILLFRRNNFDIPGNKIIFSSKAPTSLNSDQDLRFRSRGFYSGPDDQIPTRFSTSLWSFAGFSFRTAGSSRGYVATPTASGATRISPAGAVTTDYWGFVIPWWIIVVPALVVGGYSLFRRAGMRVKVKKGRMKPGKVP